VTGRRLIAAVALACMVPLASDVAGAEKKRVLIFGLTKGFRHGGAIEKGSPILKALAEGLGYDAVISEDPAVLDADKATQWDCIVFNNCTGRMLLEEPERRKALMDRIKGGAGFMGFHGAADCFYAWPEYGEMLNGYFAGHPWSQAVRTRVEDPEHPLMKPFKGGPFEVRDEIYQFRDYKRSNTRVLMSIDTRSVDVRRGARDDRDYAMCWIRTWGKGRVYYNAHGHGGNVFEDKAFQEHLKLALQWAIGDLEVDTTPSPEIDRAALAAKALESLASASADPARLEALDVLSWCPHPDALAKVVGLFGEGEQVASAATETALAILKMSKDLPKEKRIDVLQKALACATKRPVRGEIRNQLRRLGVADLPAKVPPGFVAHWWAAGTLRNRRDEMLSAMYAPEVEVDLAKGFKAAGKTYTWKKIIAEDDGVVDLKAEVAPQDNVGAYLYAEVTVEEPMDVRLLVGSEESYVVWVNGKQVGSFKGRREFKPGQDTLDASLDPGSNKILVKTLQGGGEWLVSVQIVDAAGGKVDFETRKP